MYNRNDFSVFRSYDWLYYKQMADWRSYHTVVLWGGTDKALIVLINFCTRQTKDDEYVKYVAKEKNTEFKVPWSNFGGYKWKLEVEM